MENFNDLQKSFILGLVEGLTEFIPVSSTGHLIIAGQAIGFDADYAATFDIFIQLGAILAVVVLYWNRFLGLLDFNKEGGFSGTTGILKLLVACLPAFVLGALFHEHIKEYLFSVTTVAYALIFGGILMIIIETYPRQTKAKLLEEISFKQSFLIGVFQCFAMWPGMSRSGSTIIGGLLLGLDRKVAAEFSFLVAVPVMVAAVGYDSLKNLSDFTLEVFPVFAVGFVVSFFTAILAIRFFIAILARFTLRPFGVYRILFGIVVLGLLYL